MQNKILLASQSPRRLQLLQQLGFEVMVYPADIAEIWPEDLKTLAGEDNIFAMGVTMLSEQKLQYIVSHLDPAIWQPYPLVAVDTMVIYEEMPFGKPSDRSEAILMLEQLSGCWHEVISAYTLQYRSQRWQKAVCTRIRFRRLTRQEIERYVDSGESLDKSGGYAIQGGGAVLIDRLEGSYSNVIGLPIAELLEDLQECLSC